MPALLFRLIPVLMIVVFAVLATPARAEMCRVADPTDTSLNVRDTPGGQVVNKLRNGRKVFIDERSWDTFNDDGSIKWVHVVGEYKGEWRNWGWVFARYLDCSGGDNGPFPIIFESAADMRPAGVIVHGYDMSGGKSAQLEHECFYYGDGGYSMTLSQETVDHYMRRGYDLRKLCIVLRHGDLRYDPQTGKRLPTYILIDPAAVREAQKYGYFEPGTATEELPLVAPDCFAQSNEITTEPGLNVLDIACDIRFDPWTGIELSPLEAAYYRKNVRLVIEGAAGPSGNIAGKELIVSGQNRATNASIRTVMDIRNGQN